MKPRPTYDELERQINALQIENAEIRRVKKSIESSEALHRLTLENISDTVVITDDHGKIIYACPNADKIFGLSVNQVYAKGTIQELINGNACDLSELIKVQEIPNIEWIVVDSSGRERTVLITVKSVSIEDGTVLYVMRDITERKQAEESHRLGIIQFYELFHKAGVPLCFVNKVTSTLKFNEQFEKVFGWRSDDISSLEEWWLLAYPDPKYRKWVIDSCYSEIKRATETNTDIKPIEYDVACKNGDIRKMVVFGSFIGDDLLLTFFDITERKRIEDDLSLREREYRTLVENLPDFIVRYDRNLKRAFVTPAWEEASGLSASEVIDVQRTDIPRAFFPANKEYTQTIRNVLETGVSQKIEFSWVNANGVELFLDYIVTPEYDNYGEIAGVLSVGRDITDRKQAERALRESRQKFQSMVENIGIGVTLVSPNMEILEINRQMREWFPNIEADSRSHCYRAFNDPPRSTVCEWCPTVKTFKDGQVHESITRTPFGTKIVNFRIVSSPILNERGEVVAAIEMVEDITEQLEIETRLRQVQKMESIGNLAGGIAHDFNNLLSPIIGMAEFLLEDLPQGSVERDYAEEIYKAGRRGRDLVKQILAFSRQSEHKLIPTRIQNILKEVLNLSRASIPSNIEIDHNIQEDCGMIMADPSQIHQIGMNLITNAYHAVEKIGGKITVTLKETISKDLESIDIGLKPCHYAILSISDTGHGMSREIISKIFDPYFTTKDKGKGTGIGLAVVYGIVKEHNGFIKVYSDIGKGSTFDIYLPLMERLKGSEPTHVTGEYATGNERILLVDDEEAIARLEKLILERLGYKVTMRVNSLEALEAFKAKPNMFDLVISDLSMPKMTGDQLTRELLSTRPDIPIIICTGFSERLDQEKATSIGVKGFLMKPIVRAEMAKMVRKVLDIEKDNDTQ